MWYWHDLARPRWYCVAFTTTQPGPSLTLCSRLLSADRDHSAPGQSGQVWRQVTMGPPLDDTWDIGCTTFSPLYEPSFRRWAFVQKESLVWLLRKLSVVLETKWKIKRLIHVKIPTFELIKIENLLSLLDISDWIHLRILFICCVKKCFEISSICCSEPWTVLFPDEIVLLQ